MRKIKGTSFLLFFFILFPMFSSISFSYSPQTSYSSPSYLLLNNWVNQSIWIVTGIKVPNPILNGFPLYGPSIRNLYVAPYGLLNFTLSFNINVSSAFLTLQNEVFLVTDHGNISLLTPPKTPYILILISSNSSFSMSISTNATYIVKNETMMVINSTPAIYILTNSTIRDEKIYVEKGYWYVEISVNMKPNPNISSLIKLNDEEVENWLNSSKLPKGLPSSLLKEYYLSLLFIKDDQNPYLGTFAASPSPIYLYSWVRDSAFAAIALQYAGHYSSALKFWLWMANAEQLQPGVWYTRYNFYNGEPDTTFGIQELDSIGLFEIGVYEYYNLTGNVTFLKEVLPAVEKSVEFQISQINKTGLIPQDLSVWEDRDAYHFWTEAFNDLGLLAISKIYKALGFSNYTLVLQAEEKLNQSILKNFWDENCFASALTPSIIFENGKSETVLSPEPPSVDSATLLPIDFGYLPPYSNYSLINFETVNKTLYVSGGLARFLGDSYHYSEYLYDATELDPPWIITTMFEALYLEEIGNYSQALSLMYWAYENSQHGLLPEAVNPKPEYPLPTTSPLTWSSAMFVIVALNYKPPTIAIVMTTTPSYSYYLTLFAIAAVIIIILIAVYLSVIRKR